MKSHLLRISIWVFLAPMVQITSRAEAHCPADTPGLHPRLVAGALLVVPVKINGKGPFDFMVDTGSQLNVINPALATMFQVKSQGTVGLVTTSMVLHAPVVILDSLQTGLLTVDKPLAAVQDLGPIQAADPRIRGVLGENFLAHFDFLIDYPHRLLCLDDAKLMRRKLRGDPIPLLASKDSETDLPLTHRLVVTVNLSATGRRPVLLQVDSGSDGQILFAGNKELEEPLLKLAKLQGLEVGEARRAFVVLPSQDMRLGSRVLRKIRFVMPANGAQSPPEEGADGILSTILFRRVYVSHSDHFIIFDPK
ncbi:hypothetical protein ACPOL_7036 (plasmid) [Acidisarcina polymorpha]|uniref:Peptidase A2 domain-containing protein n=1 Tax=Acidisarcina polymorpha TaxID=2211140 RepID=A0A2Z5GC65_9BACT|nr:retropepsin-like aspartic protease [Acidisarcina polymorpha]AXC16236.1 hypothetical protein ACPOL_7036 [Acidisarcina polymorpha]